MKSPRTLPELFSLPGFSAGATLKGVFGDRYARVITLRRRKKRPCVHAVATAAEAVTTNGPARSATCRWRGCASIWSSSAGGFAVRGARACM